jgi:hypothetical protein
MFFRVGRGRLAALFTLLISAASKSREACFSHTGSFATQTSTGSSVESKGTSVTIISPYS